MFIRVDEKTFLNTDHVVLVEYQEINTAGSLNPQVTLTLVSGEQIRLVEKTAGALWYYIANEAKQI